MKFGLPLEFPCASFCRPQCTRHCQVRADAVLRGCCVCQIMTRGRIVCRVCAVASVLPSDRPLCRGARLNLEPHTAVSAKVQPGPRLCVAGEEQSFLLGLGGDCKLGSQAHYQHTTPKDIVLEE